MIEERWKWIDEFPWYSVSNHGRIKKNVNNRIMATSRNGFTDYNRGHVKVSLLDPTTGERHTRSVAVLVAIAFVPIPDTLSDAVIRLDGEETNVVAWNLAWRPRWFAYKYAHQLRQQQPPEYTKLRVQNLTHGLVYPNIVTCAMTEGLLFDDVWRSAFTPGGVRIYPHRSVYKVIERV